METRKLSLDDLLEILSRRKAWLVGGALAGLLAAYAVATLSPEIYRARSVVLYEPTDAPREFFRDTVTISFRERVHTLKDRLQSERNVDRLLARLDGAIDGAVEGGEHALRGFLRRNLELQVTNAASEAQVFEVGFTARDPKVAAAVVDAVVALLIEDSRRDRQIQAEATADLFGQEAEGLRAELEERETALRQALARREGVQPERADREARLEALRQARERLTAAELAYTPEHPEVQKLRREVARRRSQLPPPPDAVTEGELAELQRAYDLVAARYQRLVDRRMEASLSRDFDERRGRESFEQLRPATVPRQPVWPNPLLLYPVGLVGGVVLASLLVAAAELRSPVFGSVRGIGESLGLPVLASIPRVEPGRIAGRGAPDDVDPRVVIRSAPESAVAEQYRGFLPLLLGRESPPIVLVTSASRGDGKSVTVANLAASAARDLGRRVLLVDADMRRPSLHRLFRRGRGRGLSDVLRGEASLAACTQRTAVPNLHLLAAGPSFANPVSLLTDDAFLKVVELSRAAYQVVFIDAPPLLPVVDARILRRVADLTVLVVRAGTTPRDSVVRSLQELGDAAGLVFNDVSPSSYRRYYYGDAYSQYAYGDPPAADGE